MRQQLSFSQVEYANKRSATRRDRFLAEMEQVVPGEDLLEVVLPFYDQEHRCGRGHPLVPLECMLRLYFLRQWLALADVALEDAIYGSQAFRGIDLNERRKAQVRSQVEHPIRIVKKPLRTQSGPLQVAEEKPRAVVGHPRPAQSLPAAQAVAGRMTGVARP